MTEKNTNTFKPEQLFGSKTRARLLSVFALHSDEAFFVRELTRKIDAQLNSVRRELKNLIELGIVQERKDKRVPEDEQKSLSDKKKFYAIDKDCVLYEDLRSFFKKVQILLKKNLVHKIEESGTVDYFVFTGVFVDGGDMPTDLLIVGDVDQSDVADIIADFETEMGHEINYTVIDKEEFEYRKQIKDRFLNQILEAEKIVMVNELDV
jgi:DNA-binding transcriptional ArsR family regulator